MNAPPVPSAKACCVLTVTTPFNPGAVAILQLHGAGALEVVCSLQPGAQAISVGSLRLVDFAGIDHGLLARVDTETWQLMPHGGPRIVQQLRAWLVEHGADESSNPAAAALFPEAGSLIEADALAAMATGASPAAIDRLARQPGLWRDFIAAPCAHAGLPSPGTQRALQHLLTPPTVVVVGPPNAGKSTLLNALAGRTVALVADLPGTTRDWVGGLIELVPTAGDRDTSNAVAVRWLDTPGLRDSGDAIEQRAISVAREVIGTADVLIAMRDPHQPWPDLSEVSREPDLWVVNKADLLEARAGGSPIHGGERGRAGHAQSQPLLVQATESVTLDPLIRAVRCVLGIDAVAPDALWAFSPVLRAYAEDPSQDLTAYVAPFAD